MVIIIKFDERKNFGKCHGIYGIKNDINGKYYIGQTRQPFFKRYQLHDWKLRNNSHDNQYLQNSYNKHGETHFEFVIVEIIDDTDGKDFTEKLNELEIKYINYYKGKNLCYNILDGGGGRPGVPLSDSAKKIIGDKNRKHMLGRKHSEETKRKMRESSRHIKMTDEMREKMIKIHTGMVFSDESKEKMRKSHLGSNNKHSVLVENQVVEIKKLLMSEKYSQIEIANMFNVNREVIGSIVREKVWEHVYVDGFKEYIKTRKKQASYLTKEQVLAIREDLKNGEMTQTEIANKYNMTLSVINGIKTNRTYKNIK